MFKSILPHSFLKFLLLVIITIGFTYLGSSVLTTIWYLFLLILYYRSSDEPFWLAFFLVTVDGFMGFFGIYIVTIKLPAIELAQFYILLTLVKAGGTKIHSSLFFRKYLIIILLYLLFSIMLGLIIGVSGEMNVYFRILKATIPLILFYSIPRLFPAIESFYRFFGFVFAILILAYLAQLLTLFTGFSPSGIMKLTEEQLTDTENFRSFYSPGATLIGMFGSLFIISCRHKTTYNTVYLYLVLAAAYGMAYLSATRGWILSFTLIIILSFIFTNKMKYRNLAGIFILSILLTYFGFTNTKIRDQIAYSMERVMTLESLASGDITAGGTLGRLDERGPRVMQKWEERPIFGWGGSDVAREFGDGHVGNQNLLMTSGIVGFLLIIGFLFYFCIKLFKAYRVTYNAFNLRRAIPIFIVFLFGWFIIHSTSGQQFGFGGTPVNVISQAIFFSFGALVYTKAKEAIYG
jgi:hypothetical protein